MDSVDDMITCQICEYQYDEVRRVPKFFNCFHTVCLECAGKIHERSGMFECPNCREVTTGSNPKCLKTNFYTTRLMALVKDGGLDLGRKASSSGLTAAPRSSASASTSKWNSGGAQVQSDAGVDGQRRRFDRRTTGVGQANGFSDQLGATGIQRASTSNSSYSGFSTPLDRRTGRSPSPDRVEDPYLRRFCTPAKRSRLESDLTCHQCFELVSSSCIRCSDDSHGTDCPIVQLKNCFHAFHAHCLLNSLENRPDFFECPLCETLQGEKTGNMPTVGSSMTLTKDRTPLPGFPDCGRLILFYHFEPGIQDNEGPHPGAPYHPLTFPKIAYLPDNEEGNKVLRLFREAWRRRLLFQIVSRGGMDVITFGPITQKVHDTPSRDGYGYPDDTYLNLVQMELNTLGIVG